MWKQENEQAAHATSDGTKFTFLYELVLHGVGQTPDDAPVIWPRNVATVKSMYLRPMQ